MNIFQTNSKLKKDNIYKFSLPAFSTCPAAADCLSWCYMRKVYILRGVVCRNAHNRNYELSKKAVFPSVAIHELESRPYIKRLRLHDSGDFYSQGYINRWERVCRAVPSVFFYFYTKSLHLNFKRLRLLNNVKMIQSEGGKYKIDRRSAHAFVINSGSPAPVGYVNGSKSDTVAIKHNRIYLYKRG
jgi:hypothetical protein